MNVTFTHRGGYDRLILIMAGWGMDSNPFADITIPGYDIAVGWDYRDESIDVEILHPYREIILVAWSMGVMEAARIIRRLQLPITLKVAVNGTETPVDDLTGIPVAIFNATLETLTPDSLKKFNRRMCGSRAALAAFESCAPQRDIESLREELRLIGERAGEHMDGHWRWDTVVIGTGDGIFPVSNQRRAWDGCNVIETEEPHLVNFQQLLDRLVVNKDRVAERFDNTRVDYDNLAVVQESVSSHLASLFYAAISRRHFSHAIEIGTGGGQLTSKVCESLVIDRLELWDIAPISHEKFPDATIIVDDAEARLFETPDGAADLIFSASTLQWFNSPREALHNICSALSPGGIAAISLYVRGTFSTLSRSTGSSLQYMDAERFAENIPADCKVLACETQLLHQDFTSTLQLLNHIKETGVNGTAGVDLPTLRNIIAENSVHTLEYNTLYLIIERI